ncbi:MAG: hypothetical protein Q7T18_12375, partial [Sedimentisphaerales bacterium]|nr:hypothetical protein [Sedimentisphaerales bacterium]
GFVGKIAKIPEAASGLANRVGKQVWNALPAAIAHGLGGPDVDPAAAHAWNAQQQRIRGRPEKLTRNLLDDEYDDIVRQLYLPPAAREKDLKDLPQFEPRQNPFAAEVAPPKNITEKVVDIGAGLVGFIGQLAVARKVLPAGTSEPAVWEAANLASGGPAGKGAAMGGVFSAIKGIPAISKLGKAAKIGAESAALGGMTAISGGDTEDIIISSLIPIAFAGYGAAKGRMTDKAMVKQWQEQLPFTRNIDYKTSLKMARAMRANWEVQQTKDPALREKQINQAYKEYGRTVGDFLKQADIAFKSAGPQPFRPKGLLGTPPKGAVEAPQVPATTPRIAQEARTPPAPPVTTPQGEMGYIQEPINKERIVLKEKQGWGAYVKDINGDRQLLGYFSTKQQAQEAIISNEKAQITLQGEIAAEKPATLAEIKSRLDTAYNSKDAKEFQRIIKEELAPLPASFEKNSTQGMAEV